MTTILAFGDWHVGRASVATAVRFCGWVAELARTRGVRRAVHLGDWFHRRQAVPAATLAGCVEALSVLLDAFERVDIVVGNHDGRTDEGAGLLAFARLAGRCVVHDRTRVEDGIAFVPYGGDPPESRTDLAFCHLPLDAAAALPAEVVVNGHVHVPRDERPVCVGPSWPLREDDDAHPLGCVLVRPDGVVERIPWPDRPRFVRVDASKLDDLASVAPEEAARMAVTVAGVPREAVPKLREELMARGFARVDLQPRREDPDDDAAAEDVDEAIRRTLADLVHAWADPEVVEAAVRIFERTAAAEGWAARPGGERCG